MNRKTATWIALLLLLVTAACSAGKDGANPNGKAPEMVNANIMLPETIAVNREATLKVQVTQGQDYVDDAADVQFEIWKEDGKENSEMIEAKHEGKGIYSVTKTFHEEGIYYVQTHVTARDMHVMPKKQFVVKKQ